MVTKDTFTFYSRNQLALNPKSSLSIVQNSNMYDLINKFLPKFVGCILNLFRVMHFKKTEQSLVLCRGRVVISKIISSFKESNPHYRGGISDKLNNPHYFTSRKMSSPWFFTVAE